MGLMNNIEHKVAAYQIAQERRRNNKPTWKYTINGFKNIISGDDDFITKRDRLCSLLKSTRWFRESNKLDDIVYELADVGHPDIDWDDDYDHVEHFDDCLEQIYDLADIERAWLA